MALIMALIITLIITLIIGLIMKSDNIEKAPSEKQIGSNDEMPVGITSRRWTIQTAYLMLCIVSNYNRMNERNQEGDAA